MELHSSAFKSLIPFHFSHRFIIKNNTVIFQLLKDYLCGILEFSKSIVCEIVLGTLYLVRTILVEALDWLGAPSAGSCENREK